MTYRSDTDALEARLDVLDKDVANRTRERDEVARLLAEARNTDAARRWLDERPRRRRRRIRLVAIASAMLLLIGGLVMFRAIRHHSQHEHDERVLAELQHFADSMCQCKDTQCTSAVSDKMTQWGHQLEQQDDYYKQHKPSDELSQRMMVIVERLSTCMTKVMSNNPEQPSKP